jgi:hypothetical protein
MQDVRKRLHQTQRARTDRAPARFRGARCEQYDPSPERMLLMSPFDVIDGERGPYTVAITI